MGEERLAGLQSRATPVRIRLARPFRGIGEIQSRLACTRESAVGSRHSPPNFTDVADKQGSRLQNGFMQERYLPSVPVLGGQADLVMARPKTTKRGAQPRASANFHAGRTRFRPVS